MRGLAESLDGQKRNRAFVTPPHNTKKGVALGSSNLNSIQILIFHRSLKKGVGCDHFLLYRL